MTRSSSKVSVGIYLIGNFGVQTISWSFGANFWFHPSKISWVVQESIHPWLQDETSGSLWTLTIAALNTSHSMLTDRSLQLGTDFQFSIELGLELELQTWELPEVPGQNCTDKVSPGIMCSSKSTIRWNHHWTDNHSIKVPVMWTNFVKLPHSISFCDSGCKFLVTKW